jgi:hypothetical protein
MDEDQVAFVAKLRKKRGADGGACVFAFEGGEGFDGLRGEAIAPVMREGAPSFPIEAEELVEQAGAFKSERDGGEIGQRQAPRITILIVAKLGEYGGHPPISR